MHQEPTFNRLLKLAKVGVDQIGQAELLRSPEPEAVTGGEAEVLAYESVMNTKLVIAYALALETLYKCLPESTIRGQSKVLMNQGLGGSRALDLACGPGFFSLSLFKYLKLDSVTGLDLSPGMIDSATRTVKDLGLSQQIYFQQKDIRNLNGISLNGRQENLFDLTSFTDAAHHMSDVGDVKKILSEMNRITRPDGLIFMMDLVRLRTAKSTESYVELIGAEYEAMGLTAFLNDFRNSMFAAWSVREIQSAIPKNTNRIWYHLVPPFLPTVQMLVGLPVGRKALYLRSGEPWKQGQDIIPKRMRMEWRFAKTLFALARRKKFL